DLYLGGIDQVVRDGPPFERDALHGVDDVAIKARKEAKAMFTGRPGPAALPAWIAKGSASHQIVRPFERLHHADAARFATGDALSLEDLDAKSALHELVSGAQAGYSSAQNGDFSGHDRLAALAKTKSHVTTRRPMSKRPMASTLTRFSQARWGEPVSITAIISNGPAPLSPRTTRS